MKTISRIFAAVAGVLLLTALGVSVWLADTLPDSYYVAQGETFSMNWVPGVTVRGISQWIPAGVISQAGNSYRTELTLCGAVPIKTVDVSVVEPDMVIPGGMPFGIKMFTQGVMVVGMSDLTIDGRQQNPAKACGIKTGDVLLSIDGKAVSSNEEVGAIIAASDGNPVRIRFLREGEEQTVTLTPVLSPADGTYKAGMWVRDSTAGIGTLTYYDPSTHCFVGLGHAVCDVDTNEEMPLGTGEAVGISITGVTKGVAGVPGELRGMFTGQSAFGTLTANTETGIYGTAAASPMEATPVRLARSSEVTTGEATVRTCIEGSTPQEYTITIEKIYVGDSETRNMMIHVTDERLLEQTGGIVQGMSGSPILQNGKLVGAVTHVFVNDPTRGYAIFAENMETTAQALPAAS
jgi:stage IV sporulation protein B